MKIILILLDGIGDRAYKELDRKTPLQAADTPNMDCLARMGSNGLFHASIPGECLPSEIAHYSIFGYDINSFPGRGLFEAVGDGVVFDDRDVLCLSHLTGIDWSDNIPYLMRGRDETAGTREELGELFKSLSGFESEGISFRLVQTRRNDAIVIMSGGASPFITDSDPIIIGNKIAMVLPVKNNPEPEMADRTARAMYEYLSFCHGALTKKKKSANFLVTQRCGRRAEQVPFEKLWGLKGLLIASGSMYMGLAREIGMDCKKVTDSGDVAGDLKSRIEIALNDDRHDFFHVHTKVPDETAHKGTPADKRDALSELDKGLLKIVSMIKNEEDLAVAVTGDHSTPSDSLLIHSGEPVPLTINCPNVRRDSVKRFDEINAGKGCLGFLKGKELLLMLLNYSDRSVLKSHQLGGDIRTYYPENYPVFQMPEK